MAHQSSNVLPKLVLAPHLLYSIDLGISYRLGRKVLVHTLLESSTRQRTFKLQLQHVRVSSVSSSVSGGYNNDNPLLSCVWVQICRGLYSYGLCSYGLYSDGLCICYLAQIWFAVVVAVMTTIIQNMGRAGKEYERKLEATHTHADTHTHTHTHMYSKNASTHACTHTCVHAHVHARTHACTHTCMHAHMRAHTHVCMHLCRHTCRHTCMHAHT